LSSIKVQTVEDGGLKFQRANFLQIDLR